MPTVVITRHLPAAVLESIRAVAEVRYWDDEQPIPRVYFVEMGGRGRWTLLSADRADRRRVIGGGGTLLAGGQHHVRGV